MGIGEGSIARGAVYGGGGGVVEHGRHSDGSARRSRAEFRGSGVAAGGIWMMLAMRSKTGERRRGLQVVKSQPGPYSQRARMLLAGSL